MKKIYTMIFSLIVIALLSACRNEFDFEEAYRANPVEEFKYNFETIFGKIAPDQSWDFSGYTNNLEGTISETSSATRAEGDDEDDYVDKIEGLDFSLTEIVSSDGSVTTTVGNNSGLIEFGKVNNASKTTKLVSNGKPFTIYPVTAHSNTEYTMYIKIGDKDPVEVFSKDWTANEVYFNRKATAAVGTGYIGEVSDGKKYSFSNNRTYLEWKVILVSHNPYLVVPGGIKLDDDTKRFVVIDSNGKKYLLYYDNGVKGFVKLLPNSKNFELTDEIGNASFFLYKDATGWLGNSGKKIYLDGYGLYCKYTDPRELLLSGSNGGGWSNSFWTFKSADLTKTEKNNIVEYLKVKDPQVTSRAYMGGIVVDAPKGMEIQIYLQYKDGTKKNINSDVFESSIIPSEVSSNDQVNYIGIDEQAHDGNYYNLVLAVVHKPHTAAKRYMVEDLGAVATSDIDFNDVVFDLKKSESVFGSETDLIIRAMGGTLDFGLNIGGAEILKKSDLKSYNTKAMYKTGMRNGKSSLLDYDGIIYQETLSDNPWIPENNNVSITVYKDENTTVTGDNVQIEKNGTYTIPFPGAGEAPCIIAFPVSKMWRDEGHSFCNDWLKDIEPALWEMPENAPDATNNTHTESFSTWISSHRSEYLNWVETKFSPKVKSSMETWLNQKYPVSQ